MQVIPQQTATNEAFRNTIACAREAQQTTVMAEDIRPQGPSDEELAEAELWRMGSIWQLQQALVAAKAKMSRDQDGEFIDDGRIAAFRQALVNAHSLTTRQAMETRRQMEINEPNSAVASITAGREVMTMLVASIRKTNSKTGDNA